jgi:hypothetical protein
MRVGELHIHIYLSNYAHFSLVRSDHCHVVMVKRPKEECDRINFDPLSGRIDGKMDTGPD